MSGPMRPRGPDSTTSPELRAVIRYARTKVPDAARVEALTKAVLAQLPAQAPAPVMAVAKGVGAWSSAKLATLAVLAALAAATAAVLYGSDAQSPPPSAKVAPAVSAATPAPTSPPQTSSPAEVTSPLENAPVATDGTPPLQNSERPARRAPRIERVRSARPAVESAPGNGADELELLQAARLARRSSQQRALELLREHEQRYPESTFREEREALLIELLKRVDPAQAAARLSDFDARYPHSAYRRALGAAAVETAP